MMRVVVIRHHDIDSAGFIAEAFEARGASLAVHLFPDEGSLPALDGVDHVIVMGAVSSVNDPDPWIAEELAWLRAADAAGLPVLGICFGAQALAAALGARVFRLPQPEIGWIEVETADEERMPAGPWLAWHEDGFELPPLAYELARNAYGAQAFCHRGHLAVQFHPEATAEIAAGWDRDGRHDLSSGPAAAAAAVADRLFDGLAARAGLLLDAPAA